MATSGGPPDPDVALAAVEALLREDPCQFQFFQAVRLLERLRRSREPVGRFAHPEREAVRFSAHNSLPFPASQIQRMEWPADEQPRMVVNFMGLTGPSGVLPLFYTELVIERVRAKDRTMAAFFDIFNHRMISLFYQAWEKYRFPVAYQRDRHDAVSRHVGALIGIGTPGLGDRQDVEDDALRYYAGLLALHPRSAEALRGVLMDYFSVPVEIEQFVGSWYPLPVPDQCRFETEAISEQLGLGTVVGDMVWDQQSKIRIRLGPLTRRQYDDFLPPGSAYKPLQALTRFFLGDTIDFEEQLVLRRDEVPSCELGAEGEQAAQLGWVTWMKSVPAFGRDPEDAILRFS